MLNNFGVVCVRPGRFYRFAQPATGHGYKTVHQLNIDILVQLNGTSDSGWGGLSYMRDLGEWSAFAEETLKIVDLIDNSLAIGRAVGVHCTHGRDRTGCVVAAYRVLKQGWPVEMALLEREEYGDRASLWIWDHEIVEFIRTLKPGGK